MKIQRLDITDKAAADHSFRTSHPIEDLHQAVMKNIFAALVATPPNMVRYTSE